ncbi:MAG: TIGR00282 family metallophosphoesterase [Planctomycetes bacterium]|nr:TIGR00282 family metallophosphoesterase [Planctomycetota bacterium]
MPVLTILFFGDVVGRPGRSGLCHGIAKLKAAHAPDLIVANGENSASGSGVTQSTLHKMLSYGAEVITTGDHFFRNKEYVTVVDDPRVLRPANFPKGVGGRGWGVFETAKGERVGVVNVMGRIFMEPLQSPYDAADEAVAALASQTKVILVDMHAEATSEKIALGWHLDGRVSAIVGTHTHIQTADERILPKGTAYITDLGMTGPYDSVIGREKEPVLKKLRTGVPARFEVAENDVKACGVVLKIDSATGRAQSIERFQVPLEGKPE